MRKKVHLFVFIICLSIPIPARTQEDIPCKEGAYSLVQPFMGNWEEHTVTPDGEVFIGTLKSSSSPNGCTITQNFISADNTFSYTSFGYLEAATGLWKEIYVFSNGNNSEYQWFMEGVDIIMRRTGGTRELEYLHQLRLINVNADSYEVIEEHSYDEGKSWKEIELTRIKRII